MASLIEKLLASIGDFSRKANGINMEPVAPTVDVSDDPVYQWGKEGSGSHSSEYDNPIQTRPLYGISGMTGAMNAVEDTLFTQPSELKEGRAKPNYGMNMASWFEDPYKPATSIYDKEALEKLSEPVDKYDPLLAAADVINGGVQTLANSRKILAGTTDKDVEYGKNVDGVDWTINDLENAETGWDLGNGYFLNSNLFTTDSEPEFSANGDFVKLTDGNWVPVDKLIGLDESNLLAKSGNKMASVDKINNTELNQLGETWWNTADSSDGNPINALLDLFDTDDGSSSDVKFDITHTPAFLYDAVVGSLPYFFTPTMAATIGSRAVLAANGYDPDSYDVDDGTYDDYKLNNKDRALSIAASVGEGLIERLGGIGAKKTGKTVFDRMLGPAGEVLDRSTIGRIGKTGLEEGLEEVPSEWLGYVQDVARDNEDGSKYLDKVDDPLADFAIRNAQAFGAGASMGTVLGVPREVGRSIRSTRNYEEMVRQIQEENADGSDQ